MSGSVAGSVAANSEALAATAANRVRSTLRADGHRAEVTREGRRSRRQGSVAILDSICLDRVGNRLHVRSAGFYFRVGNGAQVERKGDGHQDRENQHDDQEFN